MDEVRIVLVTAPGDEAGSLARRLVESRLAACANLLPGATSVYRWEGRVEEARETLVVLKTVASRVDALREAVQRHHSYDVPEFLVLPVESGLEAYLSWVRLETREHS